MDKEKESLLETHTAGNEKEPEVTTNLKQPRKAVIESLTAPGSYSVRMWRGKIPVYVCDFCGLQRDSKDDMILHVVGHYPKNKQEKVFDYLVKDNA